MAGNIQSNTDNIYYPPLAEINVTPLVDVMLVLLIIFMITSPLLIAGVEVDLPQTQSTPLDGQEEPIAVTIDKNGAIYLQETTMPLAELIEKLIAITEAKKDHRIFIRGDKTIDYGSIMHVVNAINAAGFSKVALLTETSPEK